MPPRDFLPLHTLSAAVCFSLIFTPFSTIDWLWRICQDSPIKAAANLTCLSFQWQKKVTEERQRFVSGWEREMLTEGGITSLPWQERDNWWGCCMEKWGGGGPFIYDSQEALPAGENIEMRRKRKQALHTKKWTYTNTCVHEPSDIHNTGRPNTTNNSMKNCLNKHCVTFMS